ncbi:MAG: DNA-directed RNA polymerase [Candidatus Micrarchaeota archaeon]|nr:DNA-directed RNA polymerase [Candidatus Micrarchaeota archaeon]
MFYLLKVEDRVRFPAKDFAMELKPALLNIVREKYERTVDKDNTIVLAVFNLEPISDGLIIPGDDAAYYDVRFDALVYRPQINEVVEGAVSEAVEFGVFVGMGPIEGLVHLSQITNDFLTYNKKAGAFVAKESKKSLRKGDIVYAKITTISMKGPLSEAKIGLTMRPLGLGKFEWIEKELEKKAEKEGEKKGEKEKKKK